MASLPLSLASLDGMTLLGSSPVQWSLTDGITPFTTTVDMVPSQADTLIQKLAGGPNKPVELSIETGGRVGKFRGIYVIGRAASASQHIAKVTIADRRVWWPYCHIGPRRFNWRRRVGFKRLRDPSTPDVVEDVGGDVWYAPWSLRTRPSGIGQPDVWNGQQILENVFNSVIQFEKAYNGEEPILGFDDEIKKSLPVENLLLDGPANTCIGRALSNLPEFGIYINEHGNIRVYDRSSGNERAMYVAAGSEKVGAGHVETVPNVLSRPKRIHVLFTRQVEVRFDFEELETVPPARTVVGEEEVRGMTNVLPNPDFIIDGRPQGAWLEVGTAFRLWNADAAGVPGFGRINYPLVRKATVPFMDLWAGILAMGSADPDVDWGARINAISQHYRRTFMINQKWWQRILSVHAYRVAIIDKETGARAPAAVWAHFSRMGSQRSYFHDKRANVDFSYLMNIKSYPDKSGNGPDFAEEYPVKEFPQADARVAVADPDQGVIHIDFLADENGMYGAALPSMVGMPPFDQNGKPKNAGPTSDPTERNRPLTFDAIEEKLAAGNFANVPQLAPEHRVAIILTAIPAAWFRPTGIGGGVAAQGAGAFQDHQLHEIVIENTDMALGGMVSDDVGKSITHASGPDLFVRVGAGVEVARIAWVDEKFEEIERVFGIGPDDQAPDLRGLVINEGDSNKKGASLNQISLAVAASIYAGLADHLQGGMSGTFNPELRPAGWLDEIAHSLASSGEGATKLDMPEKLERIDMMAYMDPSTQATIMKLAQPGVTE